MEHKHRNQSSKKGSKGKNEISPDEFKRRLEFYRNRMESEQRDKEKSDVQETNAPPVTETTLPKGESKTTPDPIEKDEPKKEKLSVEEKFRLLEAENLKRRIANGFIKPETPSVSKTGSKPENKETIVTSYNLSPLAQKEHEEVVSKFKELEEQRRLRKEGNLEGLPESKESPKTGDIGNNVDNSKKTGLTGQNADLPTETPSPKEVKGNKETPTPKDKPKEGGKAPKDVELAKSRSIGEKVKKNIKLPNDSKGFFETLASLPATDLVEGMKQKSKAGKLLQKEGDELKKDTEQKYTEPTRLSLKSDSKTKRNQKKQDNERIPEKGKVPEAKVKDESQGKTVKEHHLVPDQGLKAKVSGWFSSISSFFSSESSGGELKQSVQELPTSTQVDTSPGTAPKLDWEGKTSPDTQNKENEEEGKKSVEEGHSKSILASGKDFGENDVYNDNNEEIKAKMELSPSPETPLNKLSTEGIPGLSPEVDANLNSSLQGQMENKTGKEQEKQTQALGQMTKDSDKVRQEHETNVDKENKLANKKQGDIRKGITEDIAKKREEWKAEANKISTDHEKESTVEKTKVDESIRKKTAETDQQVKQKYSEAEKEAQAKQRQKEKEAEAKKAEANKKPESFWSRVTSAAKSAVKGFFEGLHKAINFIFDALRKAVQLIIEGVKKLVNGLIELARKAIVGMIKVFGEILKKLVNVALAAFPKLAKRINGLIDQAVDTAVTTVNAIAEGLKKIMSALLDLLGKALDAALAIYQKLYNLALDVLEFVALAILKVMHFIANLISAAVAMPQYLFWAEILKALVGFDPTAPLPVIERIKKDGANTNDVAQNKALLDKKKLSNDDAEFKPLLDETALSPETLKSLQDLEEGEHNFNGAKNPLTTRDLKGLNDSAANDEEMADKKVSVPDPDFARMTDDDKLNHYLDQMREQMSQPKGDKGKEKDKAPAQELPDVAKVGPLAVEKRMSFIASQMKIGIQSWWDENKAWVIPTVIGVVLGVTALIVLTGGAAIMPILSALMQGLTIIFGAILVLQIAAPLKDYITKAWNNDTKGASESLAKAFAIGLTEIIFNLIFKGLGKLFKLIGKGAKAAMRGMKKLAQSTVKLTKRLGTVLLRNGKVIFQGLKKGALKGSKSVGGMVKKLARKFRFRKFKIQVKKRRFKLFGEFNPWVLLMDGKVDYIDKNAAKGKELGDAVTHKGQSGYIIGKRDYDAIPGQGLAGTSKTGSQFVKDIDGNATAAQKLLDDIAKTNGSKAEIKKLVGVAHETSKHSATLRKEMLKANKVANPGDHAHHLVPSTHAGGEEARRILKKNGIDFNSAENGVFLSPSAHYPLHTTAYMEEITKRVKAAARLKGRKKDNIIETLKDIENEILGGTFP